MDLSANQKQELKQLFYELNKTLEKFKSLRKEKTMSEIAGVLVFILSASVQLFISNRIIGFLVWLAVYGFLLYFISYATRNLEPDLKNTSEYIINIVIECVYIVEPPERARVIVNLESYYMEFYDKFVLYFPKMDSKEFKKLYVEAVKRSGYDES